MALAAFLKKYGFILAALTGAAAIVFVLGIAAERYQFAPQVIDDGFEAAKAISEREKDTVPISADNIAQVEYGVNHSTVQWNKSLAQPGFTLLTFQYSTTAYLVDMDGKVVYRWSMPFREAFQNPPHVKRPVPENWIDFEKAEVFPNGDLLAVYEAWGDTPYGYGMVKMDKDSHVIWTYAANVHHDFYIDKHNGNIYTLIHQFIREPIVGLEGLSYPVLADFVVILSPDGKELDRIPILESFRDSSYALTLYQRPKNNGLFDRLHTNSVMKLEPELANKFPMFKAGQILISMRNLNAIAVLDPATRKIVWAHTGIWRGQHQASFLDNGHILAFDNKGGEIKGKFYSRLIEFKPDTLEVTWSYAGGPDQPFYSESYGRVHRLDKGNTLVADPLDWRVFEITPDGKIVWNYQLPRLFNQTPPSKKSKNKRLFVSPMVDDINEEHFYVTGLPTDAVRYREADLHFLSSSVQTK